MAVATVIAPTVHRTTDTDMGVGIMVMTMCTDASLAVIKAAAVWIDGKPPSKDFTSISKVL